MSLLASFVIASLLAPAAGAPPSATTVSTTFATQSGSVNAAYTWTTSTIGPADIVVGALNNCVLTGSPPFAGCTLSLGTGTVDDPFRYLCDAPLAITGCIGGTPFHVDTLGQNINAHTQTIIAIGRTATSTYSTQVGTANARYVWYAETIGPADVTVGMLDGCTLVGSPPFAGCSPSGGSGTIADPFEFSCTSSLPLAGCSGGSAFPVAGQTSNLDFHSHLVVASASAAPVAAVPLDPWVPMTCAAGVLLAFALRRRHADARRRQC